MAETTLRPTPSESQRLYSAWRYARAQWELARHAPEVMGADLPKEVEATHCRADQAALLAYLLAPVENIADLARKLRVCGDEEATDFGEAEAIIRALECDAHELAYGISRRKEAA